jgi:hypothetical protein
MSASKEQLILCRDKDGDHPWSSVMIELWSICLNAQRTFNAEVIFQHRRVNYVSKRDELIWFFVPRDHPRAGEVEAYLQAALEPIRRFLVVDLTPENGWQPTVDVSIYRYSGVDGAMAFDMAAQATMSAGAEMRHPDIVRLFELAGEEGRKFARAASSRWR